MMAVLSPFFNEVKQEALAVLKGVAVDLTCLDCYRIGSDILLTRATFSTCIRALCSGMARLGVIWLDHGLRMCGEIDVLFHYYSAFDQSKHRTITQLC